MSNVFDKTGELSREIVLSLFADEQAPPRAYDIKGLDSSSPEYTAADRAHYDWMPSEAAKAVVVDNAGDLEVGEVIIIVDSTKYGHGVSNSTTTREALFGRNFYSSNNRLHVVVSKTAKMAKVQSLPFGWWGNDLATLGFDSDSYVQTIAGSGVSRTVVRSGYTLEAMQAAVTAHPDFVKWEALKAKAVRAQAKHEAKRVAGEKKEEARLAPLKAKVSTLNDAVGVRVATAKTWGDPVVELTDDKYSNMINVRSLVPLALAGRLHLGQITQAQYDDALAVFTETQS